jgi:hypothetical protein
MKQILKIFSQTFDSGFDIRYYGHVWNFDTMKPDTVDIRGFPLESNDHSTLEMRCYKVYAHNSFQTYVRNESQYDTSIPGKCIRGDIVQVTSGRLVPIGTIAEVISIYETSYGMKVKLRDAKKEYVTYVKNLTVLAVSLSRKPSDFKPMQSYPEITKLERVIKQK